MKRFLIISEVSKKQLYIFKTNKLKENIGASAIIEYITEDLPQKIGAKYNVEKVNAGGGNSIFISSDENNAKKFIKEMTKEVLKEFPGVELFMTYVSFDYKNDSIMDAIDLLYKELSDKKSKRKSVFKKSSYGIEQRCITTGLAANQSYEGEVLSRESIVKRKWAKLEIQSKNNKNGTIHNIIEEFKKRGYKFTNDIEDLGIKKYENSYIAIVSLDGNKMGQKVQRMRDNAKKRFNNLNDNEGFENANNEYRKDLEKFSNDIKKYYKESFEYMLESIDKHYDKGQELRKKFDLKENIMPVRPIILAGDDVCFICNSKIALECVSKFISKLNENSIEGEQLNACAGVCMLKESYPFDKGYEIAETLCKSGKAKIVNEDDASLIDFHICQGEISSSLGDIRKKAHINKNILLNIKPLYLNNDNKVNSYSNFKEEYKRIEEMAKTSKGKIRKLRDVFPLGKEKTRIFMNKYQISDKFTGKISDKNYEYGFYKEENKDVCMYFDVIEMLGMFINLDN